MTMIWLPKISTEFDADCSNLNAGLYRQVIHKILEEALFRELLPYHQISENNLADFKARLEILLPIFSFHFSEKSKNLSFKVIYKFRSSAFKFFFDLLSYWLIPGKRLNVLMIYAVDFRLPEISGEIYTLCEIAIKVETQEELGQVLDNLPIIETEACLGLKSSYYARRILEVKGLAADEKTSYIQEYIAYLIQRKPLYFDQNLLSEMQHTLVLCSDDFKGNRGTRHLSRIIVLIYLFRRSLRESIQSSPEKRHLSIKIFKAAIRQGGTQKRVLGFLIGINFLREKEVFEKKHLLSAIQNYIPDARAIEDSFIFYRLGNENICTLYLEIEKADGQDFSDEEISTLRRELPLDVKERIEHLMHSIFMPRNEEEIMRNVLALSNQIKFLRDIPQVFITFDEQTYSSVFFTIILVRVAMPGSASIQEMFNRTETSLSYIHDRCKTLGYLRKKYTKEATVFRVKLPKEQFLRRDHSIDLYKARQEVVNELYRIIGEIRDFNGGMIAKQNELLSSVKNLLNGSHKYSDLLLENFFYSLTPVIMRSVLEPEALKDLFLMKTEAIEKGFSYSEGNALKMKIGASFVFAVLKAENPSFKEAVALNLNKLHLHSSDLANSYVKVNEVPYLGYIYRCHDSIKQQQFCQLLQNIVESWGN